MDREIGRHVLVLAYMLHQLARRDTLDNLFLKLSSKLNLIVLIAPLRRNDLEGLSSEGV